MFRLIYLFLIIQLLSGCVVLQPLKKVKVIESNNNITKRYAENFKYLGKVQINFSNNLSDDQKKYLYNRLEPDMVNRGFKGHKIVNSYQEYQMNKELFNEYINHHYVFSKPINKNAKEIYLDLFNSTKENYFAHIFFIRREPGGLVTFDYFVSLIEVDGEVKLAFIGFLPRNELNETINTKLFIIPFFSSSRTIIVGMKVVPFLEELFNIELQFKDHKSWEKEYFKLLDKNNL